MDHDTSEIEEILHQYLGPLESVKSILVVDFVPHGEDEGASSLPGQDVVHILAVISSTESLQEEGRYSSRCPKLDLLRLTFFASIASSYSDRLRSRMNLSRKS